MSDIRMAMLGIQQIWYDASITSTGETALSYTSVGTVACVASGGAITDSANGFVSAGFKAGMVITLTGPSNAANRGPLRAQIVAAGTITVDQTHTLVNETAGGAGAWTVAAPVQGIIVGASSSIIDKILDADADTSVEVERNADEDIIRLKAGGTDEAQVDSNGLTLKSGASVNELSVDGTMGGNSDDAVPTEKAVKTYVDVQDAANLILAKRYALMVA